MNGSEPSDNEILIKFILTILSAITGIALGAVIGFFGTYSFCLLMGNAYVQAGWAFLFFTVPIGMLAFGGAGITLALCLPPSTMIKLLVPVFLVLASAAIIFSSYSQNIITPI